MASYERYREYATASAADLAANNTVLEAGQVVVESDTGQMKVGDGSTAFTSLPHIFNDFSAVWNNAGTTFTGIKFDVTDTASAAGSLLMDLRVGGVSKVSVNKFGTISTYATINTFDIIIGNTTNSSGLEVRNFGAQKAILSPYHFTGNSDYALRWSSSTSSASSADVVLIRDAAGTLAQRNSTNPQIFRVYNTYTDASNYERGKIQWDSNVLKIGTEKAGTGTARALELQTDGVTRLTIGTTGASTFSGSIGVPASGVNFDSNSYFISRGIAEGGTYTALVMGAGNSNNQGFAVLQVAGSPAAMVGVVVCGNLRFTTALNVASDASISRIGPSIIGTGGAFQLSEMTAPAAPAANSVRIYAEDNGSGKTRLMALFATGAAQQIAIEP